MKILMVNVQESKETVKNFMKAHGYTFTALLDTNDDVSRLYGVTGHPVKFLIDQRDTFIAFGIGYRDWDTETTHRLFDGLIKELQKE